MTSITVSGKKDQMLDAINLLLYLCHHQDKAEQGSMHACSQREEKKGSLPKLVVALVIRDQSSDSNHRSISAQATFSPPTTSH